MFNSIKTKILVSQIGLVILVSCILGIFSYSLMVDALRKSQQRNLEYIAQSHSKRLVSWMDNKEKMFESIARSEPVRTYSKRQNELILMAYFDKFRSEFPILSYANEDGLEEFKLTDGRSSDRLFDISQSALFQEASWEPNKVFSLLSVPDNAPQRAQLEFAFMYRSFFDEFEGLLIGRIPFSDVVRDIREYKFGRTGFLMLIDEQGRILYHPQGNTILQQVTVRGKQSEQIISRARAMQSGFGRATILGIDGYVAYAPLKEKNWTIIATLPYREFAVAPNALRDTAIGVSLAILVGSIFISFGIAGSIANPLLKLTSVTRRVAQGDLQQRIEVKSKDEIGELANAFNVMVRNLGNANKEIQAAQEKLVRSERLAAIGQLASSISHELRNPLGVMKNSLYFLQMVGAGKSNAKVQEHLDIISKEVETSNGIISGILNFSRPGKIVPVDSQINGIVQEAISKAGVPDNIVVQTELADDLPQISIDPEQIQQVFLNIIKNAVQAMPKGGKLYIRTQKTDSSLEIIFRDSGCGISPEDKDKIFQPLFTTKAKGTGLGLSVCQNIVQGHKGDIKVESEPGKGSTFIISLPQEGVFAA